MSDSINDFATIDRFGRVVIPIDVRDRLDLKPGTELAVKVRDGSVVLEPTRDEATFVVKDGVLVYAGKAERNLGDIVRTIRNLQLGRYTPKRRP